MAGAGRTFRTNECWEQLPSVTQTSHTVSARAWQTKCTSPPNDSRQATLITTITATDNTISLDETGQYQFRIEGQSCTASVRRSRSLALVQRQRDLAPPPGVQPQPTAIATPSPAPAPLPLPPGRLPLPRSSTADRCAEPGPPARVEVRPARKLLRPGERFAFRALAVDANGCPVDARFTWTFSNSNTKLTVAPGGTVTAPEDAEDEISELTVALGSKTVRVTVEVATPERYEALLSTESVNDAGESEEAAAAVVEGASLGANPAVAEDKSKFRKTTFIIVIATLALGLATLGVVLLRRGSPRRSSRRTSQAPAAESAAAAAPMGAGLHPKPGADEPSAKTAGAPNAAPSHTIAGAPNAAPSHTIAGAPNAAPSHTIAGGPKAAPSNTIVLTHGRSVPARPLLCPSCRSEFPPQSTFCPHDGNRLVAAPLGSLRAPTTAGAGGLCPTCGRGYDPGVKMCPQHGDDLVPAAVYRATVQKPGLSVERGKICPSCGGRYGGEATFCGKDGTALVLVN